MGAPRTSPSASSNTTLLAATLRMWTCKIMLLVLLSVLLEAAPSTSSSAACKTSMDCSLNGDCVDNVCVCDPQWRGAPRCDVLSFQRLDKRQAPGYHNATESSWGGNPVKGDDGNYHLFHAQMANHCGLYSNPGG